MTKMKTTIEILEELKVEAIYCKHSNDEIGNHHYEWSFELDKLEAFRQSVEANFVNRCEPTGMWKASFSGKHHYFVEKLSDMDDGDDAVPLYTLPKETK